MRIKKGVVLELGLTSDFKRICPHFGLTLGLKRTRGKHAGTCEFILREKMGKQERRTRRIHFIIDLKRETKSIVAVYSSIL